MSKDALFVASEWLNNPLLLEESSTFETDTTRESAVRRYLTDKRNKGELPLDKIWVVRYERTENSTYANSESSLVDWRYTYPFVLEDFPEFKYKEPYKDQPEDDRLNFNHRRPLEEQLAELLLSDQDFKKDDLFSSELVEFLHSKNYISFREYTKDKFINTINAGVLPDEREIKCSTCQQLKPGWKKVGEEERVKTGTGFRYISGNPTYTEILKEVRKHFKGK